MPRAALVFLLAAACGSTPIPRTFEEGRCGPATVSFTVGALEAAADPFFAQPFTMDGVVLLHRRGTAFSNLPDDLEVFGFEPATGTERQITANDEDDEVVDAREGALLLARRVAPSSELGWELVYRDELRELVLDAGRRVWSFSPIRAVRRDRAAWLANDTVFYYDGRSVRSLSEGLRASSPPYLDGNLVVWTAQGAASREVYLAVLGETRRLTDDRVEDRDPVISASRIFWIAGGAVVMRELQSAEARVLHAGPCGAIDTHAGEAVFSCGDGGSQLGPFGRDLFFFDGNEVRGVTTRGGYVHAPRIYEGQLAWVEYDSPDALCEGRAQGQIVYAPGPADAPSAVAPVGSPCGCCGAYWPPVRLALDRALIAWNYAQPGEPLARLGRLGDARVQVRRLCAP
jgi:hypothetical protein